MRRLYFRCNSGHIFNDPYCPLDGWADDEFKKAWEIWNSWGEDHQRPLNTLRSHGISAKALGRMVVIEFGSEDSRFEALVPAKYVLNGKLQDLDALGESFL